MGYRGRFAPSPTGPLHAGSLVAALASWLDARAHGGQWLVRIEDVDAPRTVAGMAEMILAQLATLGMFSDEPVVFQSFRQETYQKTLDQLVAANLAYPCWCTRKDIETALQRQRLAKPRHGELIYPGTCRPGSLGDVAQPNLGSDVVTPPKNSQKPAWRLQTANFESNRSLVPEFTNSTAIYSVAHQTVHWTDRRLGPQHQKVSQTVGDFPLKRADGCFTYQLAVVVDDAAQEITHIVRGEDLADNTARQILLQQRLRLPTPTYLHTPLVMSDNGEKLSKQNGAAPLDLSDPLGTLCQAAATLGLRVPLGALGAERRTTGTPSDWLGNWVQQWRLLYNPAGEHTP